MIQRLRVLIADDEPAARAKLVRLLEREADVEIVGEAQNGRQAALAINTLNPDLVLLDIRMPELTGIEVIESIAGAASAPKIIFVSAFDEYAVQAFEVRALDYLVKPFDSARLGAALDRVRQQVALEHRPSVDALRDVISTDVNGEPGEVTLADSTSAPIERIVIRSAGKVQVVRLADVEWIEARGNYVRLHSPIEHPMARMTLKALLQRLDRSAFCRIHRGAIVNVRRIKAMTTLSSGDYVVRLESGVRLRLSRSYRAELSKVLGE